MDVHALSSILRYVVTNPELCDQISDSILTCMAAREGTIREADAALMMLDVDIQHAARECAKREKEWEKSRQELLAMSRRFWPVPDEDECDEADVNDTRRRVTQEELRVEAAHRQQVERDAALERREHRP